MTWNERMHQWMDENTRSRAFLAKAIGCSVGWLDRCDNGYERISQQLLTKLEEVMGMEPGTLELPDYAAVPAATE